MLQRLGLAQALVSTPRLLFLDEPASGIDSTGVLIFRHMLTELLSGGITVMLNSHQRDRIERVRDRVAHIESGQVRTIKDVRIVASGGRVLVVRWLPEAQRRTGANLAGLATQADAEVLMAEPTHGQSSVRAAEQAAALVSARVTVGLAVTEVTAQTKRLERRFYSAREQP
jgi:ABC-type multidrug transport system ATPase subunit